MERTVGEIRFGTALAVATVFKVFAGIILIGGIVAALGVVLSDEFESSGEAFVAGLGLLFGAFVGASIVAFFGYVLEILVDVYEQVFHVRHELAEAADES